MTLSQAVVVQNNYINLENGLCLPFITATGNMIYMDIIMYSLDNKYIFHWNCLKKESYMNYL